VPEVPKQGRQELVYYQNGAVDIEEGVVYWRGYGKAPTKIEEGPTGDPTELAINDFFRCILEGTKLRADAEAGWNAVLLALLGRRAIDKGRVVTMEEILSHS